jgi:hypothetical protein
VLLAVTCPASSGTGLFGMARLWIEKKWHLKKKYEGGDIVSALV